MLLMWQVSCAKSDVDSGATGGGDETTTTFGFTFSPEQPNADEPLTITFKAETTSAFYGYSGGAYLHAGVIIEGVWNYVPAGWDENLEKCRFTMTDKNEWQIVLEPSIREWFGSEETPVERLGLLIRSEDGSMKGIDYDYYVSVTDDTYQGFQPAAKSYATVDGSWEEGINILSATSAAFVLYDVNGDGQSHEYAHIVGSFNDWTLANDATSQMYRDDAAGVWWIKVDGLSATEEHTFQYYVGSEQSGSIRIADPFSEKVLDPDNDKYIPASTYSENLEYPEGAIGLVSAFTTAGDGYVWKSDVVAIDKENLVIYELLLRDFTNSGDIAGAMEKLDYIESLGVNAIELMPVQEFDGNDSWGYNPAFYFAMDKAYGTSSDYKAFIDECHSRGIAVILDVVYNHTTGNHPYAKLYWDSSKSVPAANSPYYNQYAPHPYSVFNDLNHESERVRDHVKRNLKFLLEEYKFDGFRFDLTKGFTQTECDESNASTYDQSRIDILSDYYSSIVEVRSDALMILEHFCDYGEESKLAAAGMVLWRNANEAYCQAAMGSSSDSAFSGIYVSARPGGWVGYMESHDEERLAYKQKMWGTTALKSDTEAAMGQLGAAAAFSILTPGPKMMWQFGEMGYDYSINSNQAGTSTSSDYRTSRKPIRWDYLEEVDRADLVESYSKLIALRLVASELFSNGTFSWSVLTSDWDSGRYITLTHDGVTIKVMGNFTGNAITSTLALDGGQTWYELMSGEVETETLVEIPANSFRVYTNFSMNN